MALIKANSLRKASRRANQNLSKEQIENQNLSRTALKQVRIMKPNEMHVHFREGSLLRAVVPYTARQFRRAVVMPNTTRPILTFQEASKYREEILRAVPDDIPFTPLMMAYLNKDTDPHMLARGHADKIFFGAKLYPKGATTNSSFGVSDIAQLKDVLKVMEEIRMPLSIHGECVDEGVDIFDREEVFLKKTLPKILSTYPNLKVTMEHITTSSSVDFLKQSGDNLAATITPQHLLYNRNHMLVGGIRPHLYCLPILKRAENQQALIRLATSGFKRVFLGTDSAPHLTCQKQSISGCAGVFSSTHALEFYASIFDDEGALDKFEDFCTLNSNAFHNFKPCDEFVTLIKAGSLIPSKLSMTNSDDYLTPLMAGEVTAWRADYEIPMHKSKGQLK